MAPTVSWRPGTAPRNPTKYNGILKACQAAAGTNEFSGFLTMEIWTGRHTSESDANNHGTVRIKTQIQMQDGTHQRAHIYMDENYNYTGHNLYTNVMPD